MPEKEYTRLPGRGLKRGSTSFFVRTRAQLWLGKDHLLCIYNTGYSEEYRRFSYRDIQALTMSKTPRGRNWNIAFCALALVFALLSLTGKIGLYFFLPHAFLFSLCLFINWLRGPTCICRLYTSVTKEELPSLNRIKNATKAMDRLRQKIEEVQGRLRAEEVELKMMEVSERVVQATPRPIPAMRSAEEPRPYKGGVHEAAFYLLLADGLVCAADIFLESAAITLLGMTVIWALTVLIAIALVRQHESRIKGGLRGITWMVLGYVCLSYAAGYAIFFYLAFRNPAAAENQWELVRMFSGLSPFDLPPLMGFYIFSVVVSFFAGITGLILLRRYRLPGSAASGSRK